MNKNDLRFKKTEKIIFQSFKECVEDIGFEKTTIALICEKGSISRNTFYFHYLDKYDLLDKLYQDLESKLINSMTEKMLNDLLNYSVHESVVWTYKEIEKNKDMISLLLRCSRIKMNNVFKRAFIEAPLLQMFENYKEISNDIEALLIKNYLVDAMVGYIETWLFNYDKIETERIIIIMEQLCTVPVERYFNMLFSNSNARIKNHILNNKTNEK